MHLALLTGKVVLVVAFSRGNLPFCDQNVCAESLARTERRSCQEVKANENRGLYSISMCTNYK